MADVVLVQPRVGDMDSIRSSPALPLALLHAATLVDKEYEIKLIDQRIDTHWPESLRRELMKEPLCVGITSMTGPQIYNALAASEIVKRESDVPVVWGGIHPSLLPRQTLEDENIDIVVQGEGELAFYELVKALESRESLQGIPGIWYKEDGKIGSNPERELLDLNELPDIPYHLVDVKEYLPGYMGKSTLYMQTSRGCPYNCAYCYNPVYNRRRWRALTPERTLERIKRAVQDYKPENIYFVDDSFFIDPDRCEEIVRGIMEENIDVDWQAQGVNVDEAERMDERYIRLLEESGCLRLSFGLESGSSRMLSLIRKRHTVESAIQANKKFSNFNIVVYYSFITGFPTETEDDLQQTIRLIFRLLKDNPRARTSPVYIFTPYPGTEMFGLAIESGFVPPGTLKEWASFSYSSANLSYMPKEKREMLESLYISSTFVDKKFNEYNVSPIIKLFAEIYRPIARYRVKNLFFKFMIERSLREIFFKEGYCGTR